MPEQAFWKCTPRKLIALIDVHVKINGGDSKKEKAQPKQGFIDHVIF